MRLFSRVLLLAVIAALFWGSTAHAQMPGPTLARSTPTSGAWLSPWVEAEYGSHGAGVTVTLGTLPPSAAPVELRWRAVLQAACYAYENLTPHALGVQNGATGALHYVRVNGQHADGLGNWFAWDGHDCGPFDGAHDWAGGSGHYGYAGSGPPAGPSVVLLPPSASTRTVTYTLGTAVSSTTWPSGHGYPVRAKTGGMVLVEWRIL